MPVRMVVREELFLQGLPVDIRDDLVRENTVKNPKRAKLLQMFKNYLRPGAEEEIESESERRQFKRKLQQIRWSINQEPETIILWRERNDWLALPRGCYPAAVSKLREANVSYDLEDRTIYPPAPVVAEQGDLYGYQKTALEGVMRYPTGVVEAPTGSGKTNVLLSLAAQIGTPTLILVHTTELLRQTVERAQSWLSMDAGRIGGGKKDRIEQITVAMVQTLMRRDLASDPIRNYFGCVIQDEAHHVPAMSFAHIMRSLPARYKYGFTATAWRKDQMQFLIWKVIGNLTAKIETSTVREAGKIVWPRVEWVVTDYWYDAKDTSDWTKMVSHMIQDEDRNRLIEREVRKRIDGTRALILTDRIDHADTLFTLLADLDPIVLTGEVGKPIRADRMETVRAGARLTIATVHLLGEGIDVPGWDLLFLVSPIAGGPRTLQAMGRVARPAPGKTEAVLVDFIDARVEVLKGAAKSRARIYKGGR